MRCLAAIQGESTTVLFGTQRGIHRVRDNKTFDWTVLEETRYTCLAVAGRAVDLFVLDAGLFVPLPTLCHAPSLAVHKFELVKGWLRLLQSAVPRSTWLCFAQENCDESAGVWALPCCCPSTSGTISLRQLTITPFPSESQFVEETKKGTFPFIPCRVVAFHLVTMTLQYFEHPWVITLVYLKNLFLAFS